MSNAIQTAAARLGNGLYRYSSYFGWEYQPSPADSWVASGPLSGFSYEDGIRAISESGCASLVEDE